MKKLFFLNLMFTTVICFNLNAQDNSQNFDEADFNINDKRINIKMNAIIIKDTLNQKEKDAFKRIKEKSSIDFKSEIMEKYNFKTANEEIVPAGLRDEIIWEFAKRVIASGFSQDALKFYSIEIEKSKSESNLFLPRDEFETTKTYNERLEKADLFVNELTWEYTKKYVMKIEDEKLQRKLKIEEEELQRKLKIEEEELQRKLKIKNSLVKIELKIDSLGKYEADSGFFYITINKEIGKLYVPIEEAKDFKKEVLRASVSADKQLMDDAITFRIFNIIVKNPNNMKEYKLGITIEPLYIYVEDPTQNL